MKILIFILVIFICAQSSSEASYSSSIISKPFCIINDSFSNDSLTLPVQLIYFYASVQSDSVLLKWGTATEVNNFGFDIERSFNTVLNWETIDFVLGSGTSNIPINYEYLDTTIDQNVVYYYRLKQIDVVGGFEYSDTVMVNLLSSINLDKSNQTTSFMISDNFPNPFNPSTKINFQIPVQQFMQINLYDLEGGLVKEIAKQEFLPGNYQLLLDFSYYSTGIYFVRFESDKNTVTKRLTYIK